MENKSIQVLVKILRVFGWLSIILGAFLMFVYIIGNFEFANIISGSAGILMGIIYLLLARGLERQAQGFWYLSVLVFTVNAVLDATYFLFFQLPLFQLNFLAIFSYGVYLGLGVFFPLLFLVLLFQGREVFLQQPRQLFVVWLKERMFLTAALLYLVAIIAHIYVFLLAIQQRPW